MSKKEKLRKKYEREMAELPEQNQPTWEEYLEAQAELDELKIKYGYTKPKEEKGLARMISNYFRRKDERDKILLNRKKLIRLAIFTGWCGGHRYYMKQYKLAVIYTLFFWTGWPFAMTLVDLIEIIPLPQDEDGNIWV